MSTVEVTEEDLKYPIGKFQRPETITPAIRGEAITAIAELPVKMREALHGLSEAQLDTPYRDGGWTVRQLVHHVADSHAQAVARLRWALTEDFPALPGYKEKMWAEMLDSRTAPAEWALMILEGSHARWVMILRSLTEDEWKRGITHAERGRMVNEQLTLLYAWHCRHHVAHITHLRKRMGW